MIHEKEIAAKKAKTSYTAVARFENQETTANNAQATVLDKLDLEGPKEELDVRTDCTLAPNAMTITQ